MLRIHDVALSMIHDLRSMHAALEMRDPDLAKQMKRAANSIVLNLAEGSGTRAGNRKQRYLTALGSARETMACVDAAVAWSNLADAPNARTKLNQIIGTLVHVTR